MVVHFAAGGPADTLASLLAVKTAADLRQPVLVDSSASTTLNQVLQHPQPLAHLKAQSVDVFGGKPLRLGGTAKVAGMFPG